MAAHLGRSRRRKPRGRKLSTTFFIVFFFSFSVFAEENKVVMGIAPIEEDLEAMRKTLRQLEESVSKRNPENAFSLIAPELTTPQQRGIKQAINQVVGSLGPDTRFHMRTEIGRGALVPTGPERIQVQVNGTKVINEARTRGPIQIEFEAHETKTSRRWLLRQVTFFGQRPILTGGFPGYFPYAAGGVGLFILVLIVLLVVRRRRR